MELILLVLSFILLCIGIASGVRMFWLYGKIRENQANINRLEDKLYTQLHTLLEETHRLNNDR
jgi:hypothetical protein